MVSVAKQHERKTPFELCYDLQVNSISVAINWAMMIEYQCSYVLTVL